MNSSIIIFMKKFHYVDSQISVMCGKWERNLWLLYIENFTRIQADRNRNIFEDIGIWVILQYRNRTWWSLRENAAGIG